MHMILCVSICVWYMRACGCPRYKQVHIYIQANAHAHSCTYMLKKGSYTVRMCLTSPIIHTSTHISINTYIDINVS